MICLSHDLSLSWSVSLSHSICLFLYLSSSIYLSVCLSLLSRFLHLFPCTERVAACTHLLSSVSPEHSESAPVPQMIESLCEALSEVFFEIRERGKEGERERERQGKEKKRVGERSRESKRERVREKNREREREIESWRLNHRSHYLWHVIRAYLNLSTLLISHFCLKNVMIITNKSALINAINLR